MNVIAEVKGLERDSDITVAVHAALSMVTTTVYPTPFWREPVVMLLLGIP